MESTLQNAKTQQLQLISFPYSSKLKALTQVNDVQGMLTVTLIAET